jgi:hypothetical protein
MTTATALPAFSTRTTRFAIGGTALAASATAAFAAPFTHVFDTPVLTDATITTATAQLATVDITTGGAQYFNLGGPGSELTAPSQLAMGFIGTVDGGGTKPLAFPIVIGEGQHGASPDEVNAFRFLHTVDPSGQLVQLLGVDTPITAETFASDTGPTVPGGFLIDVLDETGTQPTTQGFAAFSYLSGVAADPIYGWLEFASDLPSLSFTLLAYGFDDTGVPVTTPSAFTPYTAPAPVSIPEPSAAALGAALAAGSAALLRRRRAPDRRAA